MSNALAAVANTLTMWEDSKQLAEIRALFAPKLTETEFQFFIGLGKATGLNPFLKEIWAVKYGKDKDGNELPAQVFIGRDGYRKAAQAHTEYDYHQCDAVYENDQFEVVNGEVRHAYTLKNRGKLMGAYCVAKRHKASKPQYVFAELDEYSTGQSLWAEVSWKDNKYGGKYKTGGKPATMIKKVAESQCLRAAFQDLLGGTYGEEEFSKRDDEPETIDCQTGVPMTKSEKAMSKLKSLKGQVIESQPVDTGELLSIDQQTEIENLLAVKDIPPERLTSALEYFKVDEVDQMTETQALNFINQLNKFPDL